MCVHIYLIIGPQQEKVKQPKVQMNLPYVLAT